jgi:septum formation protein
MKWERPLVLASASPRRLKLLIEAGIDSIQFPPRCDDGLFACGKMSVDRWVQTLSVLKAQNVLSSYKATTGTVLAADTVCVVDDQILGQPKTTEEAMQMLNSMVNRSHYVYSGWCLGSFGGSNLLCGFERSEITMGSISSEEIQEYLNSDAWKGKAGAYNLSERIDAGWQITCHGDPANVMGLPMSVLKQELSKETT